MQYKTIESYQAERPSEVDTTSSKTTVYIRKNIRSVKNAEDDGTHWKIEEAELTQEEYSVMKSAVYEDLRARLDAQDETQADILLGQAEIQEAQNSQDETLANILLNQMEGVNNEQTL